MTTNKQAIPKKLRMYNPTHIAVTKVRDKVLNSQMLLAVLVFLYCTVYGITAQYVLSGFKMLYFLASLFMALVLMYLMDPEKDNLKKRNKILTNVHFQITFIVVYSVGFGVSSVLMFSGLNLLYFYSSYVFALAIFYICNRLRATQQTKTVSSSSTVSPFLERSPCFLNTQEISWLIRELNSSLSTVIGFTELMLKKQYSEGEKEYMIRIVYSQALSMSNSINKASAIIPDSPVKPKEIHEVVDLLDDKNFK